MPSQSSKRKEERRRHSGEGIASSFFIKILISIFKVEFTKLESTPYRSKPPFSFTKSMSASLSLTSKIVIIDYNYSLPTIVSPDEQCGPFNGVNQVCPGSQCCSVHQYCGADLSSCLGCWPGFGLCGKNPIIGRSDIPSSPDPWTQFPAAKLVSDYDPCLNPPSDVCSSSGSGFRCCVAIFNPKYGGDNKGIDPNAWKYTCRPQSDCYFFPGQLPVPPPMASNSGNTPVNTISSSNPGPSNIPLTSDGQCGSNGRTCSGFPGGSCCSPFGWVFFFE
jgi:hypothetical protein